MLTMKTYHAYRALEQQAKAKLDYVASQKSRLEQSIPKEKLEKSKRFRVVEKELSKRAAKHHEVRLQCLKARNEYLLCMESANAAIHKYFVEDLSDLMDCMDFGFHVCLSRALRTCGNAEECLQRSLQQECAALQQRAADLDSRADKQRFLEGNNAAFMVPRKFSFQPHRGDEEPQRVSVEHPIEEELDQRLRMLNKRLTSLCTENDEIWKTLETAERSLLDMIAAKECDCSALFEDRNGVKQPETLALKLRADKQETEDFYLEKFRDYTLGCNVVARLQAKAELMRAALGKEGEASCGATPSPAHTPQAPGRPPPPRKKRIGRQATRGQPKLFEGSLEEYLEATDQEVPLVIRSCVRVINLYGLHHQGVFRVSGSQVEINHFRDCFERGEDPLSEVSDASDINSVAGVLKLYLRELREPLFPIFYFEQLMEISQLESKAEFVSKVREVVRSFPRPVVVVLRYLFAFLNHLSEFSDENMMDPYNLAICFGPTLVPIPEDKDQVQYQNLVNELGQGHHCVPGGDLPGRRRARLREVHQLPRRPTTYALIGEPEISLQLFGRSEVLEATAQYDFAARSERELSFKRGDHLTLYAQVSPDWWRGHFAGRDGLVPDKYILLRIRDEDRTSSEGSDRRRSSDSLPGGSPPTALRGGPGRTPGARRRSLSPCFPGGPPPPDPRKLRPSTSMGDAPALELSAYDISVETSNQELARDLDHALARVHTSIDSIERSHKADAPDLVLDLPVSPNSPEAADMTAAERFALSNQCTLKKGATRAAEGDPEREPSPNPARETVRDPARGPKPPVKAKPMVQAPERPPSSAERPPPEKGYKQTSF
ncbi:hypothetical protein HPB47_004564 [Ixodes persulcatus]|uniref:Uncharacterized protein n=1 Tax=Ixodes persulcatus TaxID=34615 RepID=A0AC60PFK7_IXOPE|nr:hypothetical protein HPB47_004564 [Ixodes persulcatus]